MRTEKEVYEEQQKWLDADMRLESKWDNLFWWYDRTGKIFEGKTPQEIAKMVDEIIDTVQKCIWAHVYNEALYWVLDEDCSYYRQKEKLKQAQVEYKDEERGIIEICLLRIADRLRLKRLKRRAEKAAEKRQKK